MKKIGTILKVGLALLLLSFFLAVDCVPRGHHVYVTIVNNSDSTLYVLTPEKNMSYKWYFDKEPIIPPHCQDRYYEREAFSIELAFENGEKAERAGYPKYFAEYFFTHDIVFNIDSARTKQELLDANEGLFQKYAFSLQQLIDNDFTIVYP